MNLSPKEMASMIKLENATELAARIYKDRGVSTLTNVQIFRAMGINLLKRVNKCVDRMYR